MLFRCKHSLYVHAEFLMFEARISRAISLLVFAPLIYAASLKSIWPIVHQLAKRKLSFGTFFSVLSEYVQNFFGSNHTCIIVQSIYNYSGVIITTSVHTQLQLYYTSSTSTTIAGLDPPLSLSEAHTAKRYGSQAQRADAELHQGPPPFSPSPGQACGEWGSKPG